MHDAPSPKNARRRGPWRVTAIVVAVLLATVLVVVGGGVGVLSGLFASGDPGLSNRVVGMVNALLATESTRFACDRVRGTILRGAILERPRLLIRRDGGTMRWAQARRATVEFDLLALLFSRRRVVTVHLDSLAVNLERDSTGAFRMPRFRSGGGGNKSPATLDVRLALRHASVSLPSDGLRFTRLTGDGTLTLGPSGSTVAVQRLTGLAEGADRTVVPLRLQGAAALGDSSWRIDPLAIVLGRSSVRATAEWDPDRGRVREGTLQLRPLVLDEVLPLADIRGVSGTMTGEVSFDGLPSDGSASACLEGTLAGEAIDTLLVDARFEKREVRIEQLRTRLRGATFAGTGLVEGDGTLGATLRFTGADPANLPWWKAPAAMPAGSLAGEAVLRIRRARPRPAVQVTGTLGRGHVGRLPIERASFRVHAPPLGGVVLDSLVLDTPGARVTGSGAVQSGGALRATAVASIRNLGAMGTLLDPVAPQQGSGRLTATLGGTLEAPTLEGRATLVGPRTESGLRADTVLVAAAGPLAPTLDLRGTVRIASLASGRRALGNVRASFTGGVPLRVAPYVQSLGDTTLTVRGALTFGDGGVRADVDSLRLVAGPLSAASRAPARFSYVRGRLRASRLALELEPGRVELDLDWDVSAGRIDLRGMLEDVDLARLSRAREPRVAGRLRAQFLVSGPTADPQVSLRGAIDAPRLAEVRGDSLLGRIHYAPGVLTVESLSWRSGVSGASVAGTLRPRRPLEEWLREALRGEAAWRGETAMALQVEADSFDVAALAPIDSTWSDLQGAVNLRARIGGTVAAPTATVSGEASRLHVKAFDGSIAVAELEYADRRLAVNRLDVRQGAASTRVTGTVPVDLAPFAKDRWLRDEPVQLSLRMDETDMSILPELTNLVAASAGKLSGDAEVRGTLRHPRVTGTMQLREGRIRFAGRYEVLEQVTMDGTFDEEKLTLTRIEARQGKKGRIAGSGTWRWSGARRLPPGSVGPPGSYTLALKATDCVATDREYYLFRFSGTFTVEDGTTPDGVVKPRVTGQAVVSRGDLTMNLATPANEPRPPLPFLYDIRAEFPQELRYRQLDTEVDLAGSLQLRNEGERDVVLGTLSVRGGQFYFLTRKFTNLTGEVNFNSLERLDPDVAIDASTRIRSAEPGRDDRLIYLAITGRASELQIRPWVEGGTSSPTDLWRELSVGQFAGNADPAAAAGNPLTDVGYLPIGGYLFRNAERWIAESGFIDTIDLQSGGRSGSTTSGGSNLIDLGTVGVGKYVTPDLYLKYSRDFSGENDQRISAEYRVTRHLLLRGTQIRRDLGTSGSGAEQEYNLDLKIRVEY